MQASFKKARMADWSSWIITEPCLIPAFLPCRGLQDELFNLTLDLVKVEAERTRAEAKLDGSIQRVQLDNQMLVGRLSSLFPHLWLALCRVLQRYCRCTVIIHKEAPALNMLMTKVGVQSSMRTSAG
jgi:hypothetical protein